MKNVKKNKTDVDSIQSSKYTTLLWLIFPIIITIAVLICYHGTYGYPFQFDDYVTFVNPNSYMDLHFYEDPGHWLNIINRPLSKFSLALNRQMNGLDPSYYHVFNITIHILNSLLAFFLTIQITRFFMRKDDIETRYWLSFFTAVLFAAHPIQIQAITYIVQRMTSLAAFFYMLSVYFYGQARILHTEKDTFKPAIIFYGLAFLAMILSFMSKPNAISLPLMFLLYEICFIRNRKNEPNWKFIISCSCIFFIGFIIILFAGKLSKETDNITRNDYFLTQFKVIIQYFRLLIIPVGLNIDHDIPVAHKLTLFIGSCMALISAMFLAAVVAFKKNPILTFAIGWFFIALSAQSSIIPIRDVIFEHRLYSSIFGFTLIIVFLVWQHTYVKYPQLFKVILILITIIWGGLTIQRNKVWQTEESLWLDASAKSPAKSRPYRMLGDIYLKQDRLEEAYSEYQKGMQADPLNFESYVNRGAVLEKMQRFAEAQQSYLKAHQLAPKNTIVLYDLGHTAFKMNNYPLALSYFNKVIALQNDDSQAYLAMASVYEAMGDITRARIIYQRLVNDPAVSGKANLNLGISYLLQEDGQSALPYLNKVIRLDQANPSAYYHVGSAYMMIGNMNLARQN